MQKLVKIILFAVCIAGVSCVGQQKMNAARERLNRIKEEHQREAKQLQLIEGNTALKRKDERIDSIINSRFDFSLRRINIKIDSVTLEILWLDSLMKDRKSFRRLYKRTILPRLALLDSFRAKNEQRKLEYGMIEAGINVADYTLFDLAAFFGPGKYTIPEEQQASARTSFEPLIDAVLNFSAKYKNVPRKATLVILGYADGAGFDAESGLYAELAALIGQTPVTKEELNKKLSELRAQTLIRQLQEQFNTKLGNNADEKLRVEFIGSGKGEQYPFQSIRDYKEEDERRRIVLCYWSVLPG
jgi:outer membrane protein OmpA-like peptidoglycan-associated protein